jgi:outer membrane PBP1 activator LpoA protein
MASDDGFAQRAVKAFKSQFKGNDGVVAASFTLNPAKVNYAAQIRSVRDALQPGTGIFISMRPEQARLLMPQLHLAGVKAPVFATSQVYDGHDNPVADGDLDGVEFCDAPWLFNAQPGLPPRDAIAGMLPAARGTSARLFAFGMDAWSLVPYLHRLRSHPGSYLAGASGRLSEDDFGRVHRTLMWARFTGGIARPLDGSLEIGHLTPATSSSATGMPTLGPLPASAGSSPAPASSAPSGR